MKQMCHHVPNQRTKNPSDVLDFNVTVTERKRKGPAVTTLWSLRSPRTDKVTVAAFGALSQLLSAAENERLARDPMS